MIKRNYVDDVLLGHVGLPHVLANIVHLEFFYAGWIEGIILSQFYSMGFFVGPLLHAQKLWGGWWVVVVVVVVVAYRILVSAQALSPCHCH